jgi:hypothetical protein
MKAVFLALLKKIGTRILLALAEETVKVLSERADNAISKGDIERIKKVREGL